ncbi:hypothetical protein ABBQ38_011201 [Trebouxia sp. C0009 RCD-2024]
MEKMQRVDAAAVDVENLRPGLLSETETSDPSVVSKRRRLDPPHAGPSSRSFSSKYRGVSWHNQTGKWKAQIKVLGKDVNLGRHVAEDDAARAYDKAAICARGKEVAKLNFSIVDYSDELEHLQSATVAELAPLLRGEEERLQAQTSRFHGVRQNKRSEKWESYIRVAGKHQHLGCHDSETAAAQAFDQAVMLRHVYCRDSENPSPLVTNFPPEYYQGLLQQVLGGNEDVVVTAGKKGPNTDNAFFQLEDKYVQQLLQRCQEQQRS